MKQQLKELQLEPADVMELYYSRHSLDGYKSEGTLFKVAVKHGIAVKKIRGVDFDREVLQYYE